MTDHERPHFGEDRAWFTADVAVHLDAIYRYFVRRAPRQDADDLTAEVFTTAWRRRDDVPREAILPWLYRTAAFTLANHRRRALVLPLRVFDIPADHDHAERIAAHDELSRALAHLTPRDREILLLHAWDGLDGTELGEALGITRSGAQAALSRARAQLRRHWRVQDVATRGHLSDEEIS